MSYKNQCFDIYLSRFSDDGVFAKKLFEECSDNIEYIEENGEIVCYLFLLPCVIEGKNAKYIFAVATKKEYEGKGYMSRLLKRVIEKEEILFLRPVNESLIAFYERFGFKLVKATAKDKSLPNIIPKGSFKDFAKQIEPDEDNEYTFMYLSEVQFDKVFFEYSMD